MIRIIAAGTLLAALAGSNALAQGSDLLPNLPSFIRRVCSSFAPPWGVLRTRWV